MSVVALPASDVEDAGILDGERRSRASEGVMRSDLIHDQCEYLIYMGVVRLFGARHSCVGGLARSHGRPDGEASAPG